MAAVLSNSATAFAPLALAPRSARTSSLHLDPPRKPQVLPGFDLPSPDDIPDMIPYPFVDLQRVPLFLGAAATGAAGSMLNRPKSTPGTTIVAQRAYISTQKIATQIPNPGEYKFFGNSNHAKNLAYLLKTNPFMASALTERGDGFELRAFDKEDPEAKDGSATLFRQIMSCLGGGAGHRVNIRFNSDMTIDQVRVYEENSGKRIAKIKSEDSDEVDKWASSALFNIGFYASSVHANIHVLHYLLTAGLDFSSQDFEAMNEWAKFYATNIPEKYGQVGALLIRGQPNIGELLKKGDAGTVLDTYALLTGSSGFGADGDKLRGILSVLLNTWVEHPTSYLDNMMNIPKEKMEEAGILTEFMKHHDLVPKYARDVRSALEHTDKDKFVVAENRLEVYFKRCAGLNSKIDSLEDWIEIMAVTGIVHGGTLSYSRLFADADILRWRDIQSSTWKAPDVNLHLKLLGTICGMDEHRHVMSSSTDTVGKEYDAKLQHVLERYERTVNHYKEAYKNQIMENSEEFNNYGWILSDFCPDGFDGKQLTVATYI